MQHVKDIVNDGNQQSKAVAKQASYCSLYPLFPDKQRATSERSKEICLDKLPPDSRGACAISKPCFLCCNLHMQHNSEGYCTWKKEIARVAALWTSGLGLQPADCAAADFRIAWGAREETQALTFKLDDIIASMLTHILVTAEGCNAYSLLRLHLLKLERYRED